jgi:exodeoxyribonuclease VII large subunit
VAIEQPRLVEEPTLSVGELCAGIGRAVSRAYPEAVWVRGEIANKRLLPQGHVFFDLVDGDGDGDGGASDSAGAGGDRGRRASIPVVLWRTDRTVVNSILRRSGHAVRIDDGTEVRIRAEVRWHPRQGVVRLRMLAIDTAYTFGRLAEARELLLRTLDGEGLLARQRRLDLPMVPLRVGLVTSANSAAAADFLDVLSSCAVAWKVLLVDTRVQGAEAEASIVRGLAAATGAGAEVVCLVRGGGSRTDLATFDRDAVARAVAGCEVPVLTGIGHEIDGSVADLVAHRSFTTPTACAAFVVDRVDAYLDGIGRAWEGIEHRALVALGRSGDRLEQAAGRTHGAARHHLRAAERTVEDATHRLAARPARSLGTATRVVDGYRARLDALDPARLLARGWTVTRRGDGRLVRSSAELTPGDQIVTTFADGETASRVEP